MPDGQPDGKEKIVIQDSSIHGKVFYWLISQETPVILLFCICGFIGYGTLQIPSAYEHIMADLREFADEQKKDFREQTLETEEKQSERLTNILDSQELRMDSVVEAFTKDQERDQKHQEDIVNLLREFKYPDNAMKDDGSL